MRIAICEDEEVFRKKLVEEIDSVYRSLDVIIDTYASGEELLARYEAAEEENMPKYQLIFLDIEMEGRDGVATAQALRQYGYKELIVFLTSHTELAMKGYEVTAFRFLAKPVEREKLREALQEAEKYLQGEKYLELHTSEGECRVALSSIIYVESMKNDVYYHCERVGREPEVYRVRTTISNVEKELKEQGFFRSHRSYLICLEKLLSYNAKEVTMEDGNVLPLSRGKAGELKKALLEM